MEKKFDIKNSGVYQDEMQLLIEDTEKKIEETKEYIDSFYKDSEKKTNQILQYLKSVIDGRRKGLFEMAEELTEELGSYMRLIIVAIEKIKKMNRTIKIFKQ
jgi:hypothetical protein